MYLSGGWKKKEDKAIINVWIISKMKVLIHMHESLRNGQVNKGELKCLNSTYAMWGQYVVC